MSAKQSVLFLCTGNSCRSQMAEGFARSLRADEIDAYSAGTKPHAVNPDAIKVMAEIGIDISAQKSKHVEELRDVPFDCIVTVCDNAKEQCPLWLGKGKALHHSFEDPPALAAFAETEDEKLSHYRRIRDEIRVFIERLALA